MLRALIGAALLVLCADAARAQITPVTSALPDGADRFGFGGIPYHTRSPEDAGRDAEVEYKYREALKKIPDRKPSNDPWKTVRPARVDRHTQPQ